MQHQFVLLGAAVLAATLLAGCGDSHPSDTSMNSSSSSGGGATMMSLDTAQVLALAQVPSESGQPMSVNGGALTLDDTSDTAQPIAVNSN